MNYLLPPYLDAVFINGATKLALSLLTSNFDLSFRAVIYPGEVSQYSAD